MARTYVVRLARASGDKKRVYDVKLRLPTELAKKLGMRHGTPVLITLGKTGFKVSRKIKRGRKARPTPYPPADRRQTPTIPA